MKNMRNLIFFIIITISVLFISGCFLYEEMEFNNPYDPDAEDAEVTLDYNYGMLIDGETSDWDDIDPIIVDDTGEAYTAGVDIAEVKAVQDDENIYFYIRSANGTPLESYGSSFSIGFANYYDDDQYEKANFNFSNDGADRISTGGSYIYTTGGYEEYYDPETEEWYTYPSSYTESFSNPGIRFAGSTYGSDTLEYSIAKSLFWDNVGSGDSFSLDVNAYDSSYSDQDYASGMNIILNDGGTTPSYDEPGVQFVKNYDTLSIDGDMSDWNSDELWFRDFTDDDPYTGIDNTNIENVYVRHDDDCVYFLITLNDPTEH